MTFVYAGDARSCYLRPQEPVKAAWGAYAAAAINARICVRSAFCLGKAEGVAACPRGRE
ncbi:hypothetical protein NOVOSPHI9U_620003 [Novosphingobium sp. 9U]|nr:hypothetical protein NOVOSPHI9U_620003 [Novosphingobium sp. 9U]